MNAVVEVRDLSVGFATDYGEVEAVDEVSFEVREGEILGLVGESGSGKSVTATAILRLIRKPGRLTHGSIMLGGRDLCRLDEDELQQIRGTEIAMISQTPRTALNPLITVGQQVARLFVLHAGLSKAESRKRAIEMLTLVGIPEPERRAHQYPHELSGGMRQRVAIAIAIACEPKLLIADEPTTALDVTVQRQILDLLEREQRERGMAMILITHDLGVAAGRADDIMVMYAGRAVEMATTREIFRTPRMPYTEALLRSLPRLSDVPHTRLSAIPGRPPDLARRGGGCAFAPRCRYRSARCEAEQPALAREGQRGFACFHPIGLSA